MKTIEELNAEVSRKILARIAETLDGMGCVYAIKSLDGEMIGNLDSLLGKKKKGAPRKPSEFPIGELKSYVEQYIKDIKPGQVMVIPADKFGCNRVQTSACNIMSERFGRGVYRSTMMRDDNAVVIEFHNGFGG